MKKVTVIGAGSFGTTLAILLNDNQHHVSLYTNDAAAAEQMNQTRTNEIYLPGVTLDPRITITHDLADALRDTDAVVYVIPSVAMVSVLDQVAEQVSSTAKKPIMVIASKGFDSDNLLTLSQVAEQRLATAGVPATHIGALSGPTHAEELGRKIPTTCVAASDSEDTAKFIQDLFMTPYFRVYTNTDLMGVELAGALKNVIALAAGTLDGMGYGDNTKAALMTRGIKEVAELGVACGARESTFYGLAGIGDLIVTCTSVHSRNLRAGRLLGQGKTIDQARAEIGQVIEGANAARAAMELAHKYGVEAPIVTQVNAVLEGRVSAQEAIAELMGRARKEEYGLL